MELTTEYGSFPEWPKGTDCKSAAFASVVRIHQLPPTKPHERKVCAVLVFLYQDLYNTKRRTVLNHAAFFCGGDGEIRTPDLLHAKQALSQLSYTPTYSR
mgnify:CR=1 FL=1